MPAQLTYRVRQLPAHIRQFHEVSQLLNKVLSHHGAITVHSLATSIDSLESPPTKVATVTFDDTPATLQTTNGNQWKFSKSQTLLSHNIVVDLRFDGFTVLNEVDSERHVIDCIAVSGLAGHPFGSWNGRDSDADFMWLRDALPKRYPNMRVILYGYDAPLLRSESFQTIPNLSSALVHQLHALGFFEPSAVPTCFIGHSLGGIVIKEALSQIANASDSEDADRVFLSKVKQAILFGVPNRGMRISHLLPMVKGQANEDMIRALGDGSPYLKCLDEQFLGLTLTREIDIVSVYETHKSQVPKLLDDGSWKREGPWEVLVKPESAIQRGTKRSRTFEINKDHSNLVKLSEFDASLMVIMRFLKDNYDTCISNCSRPQPHTLLARPYPGQEISGLQQPLAPSLTSGKDMNARQILRESLVNSLYNHELDYRFRTLEVAHTSTLHWLFRRSETTLLDWIERGNGLYWIRGKPGSGKSTIMKHVINHCEALTTESSIQGGATLNITAKFFLFRRGSLLQKSYEGLLRAILYQVLTSAESVVDLLIDVWSERTIEQRSKWSVIQLEVAWDAVLRQQKQVIELTLFLDALDEFDGPVHKIADFVHTISHLSSIAKTRVRVCFASRPWNVFRERFDDYPGFQAEQHTQADIQEYIRSRFLADKSMRPLLSLTAGQRLLYCINERAQGVFMWVRLVLDRMLVARTNGAGFKELESTLDSLPNDLEALYQAILTNGTPREFWREAYVMLEILVRFPRSPMLHELQAMTECALDDWPRIDVSLRQLPETEAVDIDLFERRLSSRCGGLIEVIGSSPKFVQVMHDTVRDFVLRPRFRNILLVTHDALRHDNGHTFIAKFVLSSIHSTTPDNIRTTFNHTTLWSKHHGHIGNKHRNIILNALHDYGKSLKRAEQTTGISLGKYVDCVSGTGLMTIFGSLEHKGASRPTELYPRRVPFGSRIMFALAYGLEIYLNDRLITMFEALCSSAKEAHLLGIIECFLACSTEEVRQCCLSTMNRLLAHDPSYILAMQHNMSLLQTLCLAGSGNSLRVRGSAEDILPMVKLLLHHGSDPNERVFSVDRTRSRDGSGDFVFEILRPLHRASRVAGLTQVLIDAGADVNGSDDICRTPLDEVACYLGLFKANHDYRESDCFREAREHCERLLTSCAKMTSIPSDAGDFAWLVSEQFLETSAWHEFKRNPLVQRPYFEPLSEDMLPQLDFLISRS